MKSYDSAWDAIIMTTGERMDFPIKNRWWRDWFNDIYLDVYAHRDEAGADKEIRAIRSLLPLQPMTRILDLCCGNGRHCRALRREGFENVVGVDFSHPLLRHALAEKPQAEYLRADMRLLPFSNHGFDVVLSFFTSFGYFKTNVENLSVLHEIARVLKSGGWFLLDYLNPAYVRKTFLPESEKKHGEYTIRERRSFSDDGERIEKEIFIENWGGDSHRFFESVRLYEYEEMQEMLRAADLDLAGCWGSFAGEKYGAESPRMILFGTRGETNE
jgi:SAM-dependent methyltransferase